MLEPDAALDRYGVHHDEVAKGPSGRIQAATRQPVRSGLRICRVQRSGDSLLCVFAPADGETGEDVACALGERRAAPRSAGLAHGAVGGHVRSQAAHEPTGRSDVTCASLRHVSLHAVWSQYAARFHPLLSQGLGNDCTHSCGL